MAASSDVLERLVHILLCLQPALFTVNQGFPQVWEMEALSEKDADDGEDSDSEDDEDDERPTKTRTPTRGGLSTASSAAYREFLQFLELGCLGSPIQGYPAVLIILSTIPSSVRTSGLDLTDQLI